MNNAYSITPHKLVIAEKPSVARSIADVIGAEQKKNGCFEGNGYLVAWCFGHLLELAPPDAYGEQYKKWRYADLPIVPQEWKHVPAKDKKAQLGVLKDLMNRDDVSAVINACDAGREGELIFRLVYEYANCRKDIKRLWISSLEDAAIREGFANLKDGAEYENLYAAASCREKADWLAGISATRLFSVLYGVTLNVGRVQSPTLAMLVRRENDIANFVKTPFYSIELDLNGFTASSERFSGKAEAESLLAACDTAAVTSVKRTEKSATPPKLYDLTTLQRDANRILGYTAQQTLDYAQSLYEKKLATYPRTSSRHLTDDMAASVTELVRAINPGAPCEVSQVISVQQSDHHAIIPTAESVTAGIAALPRGETAILKMLKTRLICAVGEKHRYLETLVTLESGGAAFKAKGKTVLHNGWKDFAVNESEETDGDDGTYMSIPCIADGQTFPAVAKLKEGFTSPPKHLTDDTLLSAMESAGAEDLPDEAERKGLGTPATRAAIIEKLVKAGLAERSKKNLIPTEKGKNLIAVLPTALTSAKLTAVWENKLLEVQRGNLAADEFMDGIAAFTKSIVLDNAAPKPEFATLFPSTRKPAAPELGKCPRCTSPVREGQKGYFCDKRGCGFKLWKASKFWTMKRCELTPEIVTAFLKDGRVKISGLYSEKTGKTYAATILLDDNGGDFIDYKMEFDSKKGGTK